VFHRESRGGKSLWDGHLGPFGPLRSVDGGAQKQVTQHIANKQLTESKIEVHDPDGRETPIFPGAKRRTREPCYWDLAIRQVSGRNKMRSV
jgi:hypothetical protein